MGFPFERFGYHVVFDKDIIDALEWAASHGFGYIVPDLMIPRFWPECYTASDRRRIRRHAEDVGVSIAFHAPSDDLSLVAPYPEVRDGILRRMGMCLNLAQDVEAKRFTIHPSQPQGFSSKGRPGTYLEDHRSLYLETLKDGIRGIVAKADGVQVCVENEPLTPFVEEALEGLIGEGTEIYLTLDAPKALDPRKGEPVERVEAFYARNVEHVREIHLHDRRPGGTYHDVLGQGDVDVEKYLRWFADRDVHFTLEIRPREEAHKSLQYIQGLWESI